MDYGAHLGRDAAAFEAAARLAAAQPAQPQIPSCPGWAFTDLILHLGRVQRFVTRIVGERLQSPPDIADVPALALPAELTGLLSPRPATRSTQVPAKLVDWFAAGAAGLVAEFTAAAPGERVWSWWTDHTVGFWQRMQAIEAAVHRWDAQLATGRPDPVDPALAADAVSQTFEVMAPARRAWAQAPPGGGERFLFRRTDGDEVWAVRFTAAGIESADPAEPADVEAAATASDLALYLWHRIGPGRLTVAGDAGLLGRYFELVPPL
jgi:uncharacterized protein (TIGR03083 family)